MWISREIWQNQLRSNSMKEQKFWKNVEWFHFLFSIFVIWIHADNISSFTEAGAQVTGPFVLEGFIIKYLANLGVAGF